MEEEHVSTKKSDVTDDLRQVVREVLEEDREGFNWRNLAIFMTLIFSFSSMCNTFNLSNAAKEQGAQVEVVTEFIKQAKEERDAAAVRALAEKKARVAQCVDEAKTDEALNACPTLEKVPSTPQPKK